MGLCFTNIELSNARRSDLAPLTVRALGDTGALHLCIPEHIALQLGLTELEKREVTLADGSKKALPCVGPVHLRFGNRSGFMGAMVLPQAAQKCARFCASSLWPTQECQDEVLLGAIPMEDLDLIVHPATQSIMVNPQNPNLPASVAKGLQVSHGYNN